MKLEFISKGFKQDGRVSFWGTNYGWHFYIVYDESEEKMLSIFEKEFKLNCKAQLE